LLHIRHKNIRLDLHDFRTAVQAYWMGNLLANLLFHLKQLCEDYFFRYGNETKYDEDLKESMSGIPAFILML
jgi:hypothetical protein